MGEIFVTDPKIGSAPAGANVSIRGALQKLGTISRTAPLLNTLMVDMQSRSAPCRLPAVTTRWCRVRLNQHLALNKIEFLSAKKFQNGIDFFHSIVNTAGEYWAYIRHISTRVVTAM